MTTCAPSLLVAGVGNIFFSDDGFGPEVVRALGHDPPAGAKLEDFGIRGLHLAYELLGGYTHAILIDAVPRGGAPGTLYVIAPEPELAASAPDAHRMDLRNVFAYLRVLGGEAPPITIVGCEPATTEPGMGLSAAVCGSIDAAAALVRRVAGERRAERARETAGGAL